MTMASPTKASSHESSMFGMSCRPYRCFGDSKTGSEKKRLSWFRRKSLAKSTDETSKASNIKSEERKGDEVHSNDDNPNSRRHKSRSSGPTFFKSSSQTTTRTTSQTLSRLMGNLSSHSVDTQKSHYTGPLKRTSWSQNLETKNQGKTMAQSGPLLGATNRKENKAPIMYSESSGLVMLLAIEESLECSLEELCFGCVKRITVSRAVVTNNRQVVEEEDTFSIKVKPGWTKGTRITFEGTKDEEKGTQSCNVIFVITEKKHELYRREGDDLELTVRISLLQALTGCTISVPLLGGDTMSLTLDEIIVPGYEKIIEGHGMRNSKGHRGNLKVTFLVDFPEELTENQRSDIATILQDTF